MNFNDKAHWEFLKPKLIEFGTAIQLNLLAATHGRNSWNP